MGEPSSAGEWPEGSEPSGVPQPTPAAEMLEGLLRQRWGSLPRLATIARLRRGPDGRYEPTGDPTEVLERRQAANAKERERVSDPQTPRTPQITPGTPCHIVVGTPGSATTGVARGGPPLHWRGWI